MGAFSIQNYLRTASSFLGRDALSAEGLGIFFLAVIISTQLVFMVGKALSGGNAEYFRSMLLSILTIMLFPLAMIGLGIGLEHAEVHLQRSWMVFLSLILPVLLVTSFLAAKSFGCNFYSGFLSILPVVVFWFFLIILLNQMDEALISGSQKADSIKERTAELDQLLK